MNQHKHLFDAMQEARIAANAEHKAKTNAERQAALKARRKAAGLVRVSVWVPAEHAEHVRAYAELCATAWDLTNIKPSGKMRET